MAITEAFRVRGSSGRDTDGSQIVTEIWSVTSSNIDDSPADIIYSGSLPAWGARIETNTVNMDLVCRDIDVREKGPYKWEAAVTYRQPDPFALPDGPSWTEELPLHLRPASLSWDTVEYEEATDKDAKGIAYINSAGDPFDNAPGRQKATLVVNIQQYQLAFDPAVFQACVGKINGMGWLGMPKNTIRLRRVACSRDVVYNTFYYNVNCTFEYRDDPWQPVEILDRGTRVLNDDDELVMPTTNGIAHGQVVRLDGSGKELAKAEDSKFKWFYPFYEANFDMLALRV